MNLLDAKINTECIIKSVDIVDEKICIRIMELGIIEGAKIIVKNKSVLKKTLLIIFNSSCFTIKDDIARSIQVIYV